MGDHEAPRDAVERWTAAGPSGLGRGTSNPGLAGEREEAVDIRRRSEGGSMGRQSWRPRPAPDPWGDGTSSGWVRGNSADGDGNRMEVIGGTVRDASGPGSNNLRPSLSTLQPPTADYFSQYSYSQEGFSPSPGADDSDRNRSNSSFSPSVDIQASGINGHSSSSSISRASSARSTSSVQAVPLRTPIRTPARSPALSRTGSQAAVPRGLVPSFLFRPGSSSGTPAIDTPTNGGSGKNSPQALSELGGARVPAPLTETSREYATSIVSPTSTIHPLHPHVQPYCLNPPQSARQSFLNSLTGSSSNTSGGTEPEVFSKPEAGARKDATGAVVMARRASEDKQNVLLGGARPDLSKMRTSSSTSLAVAKSCSDFNFGDVLGEGSYSTVYHATEVNPPHRAYAIKVLDKRHISKEKKVKYVAVERDTLNRLDRHPGCLRLYWTFQDANCLYYVLEYAAKGEILKTIKQYGSFSPDCARFYAAQILSAVEHMHSRGVIHRDLKPENILLDESMRVKMADFGSAKILKDSVEGEEQDRAHSFVGTAEYVSPELLTDKVSFKSSDFWAFGCVVYQLLAGHPPFKSRSEYLTFQKITNLDYEMPEAFPEDAKDLIRRLLVLKPEDRLGAKKPDGIEAIKRHPFFQSVDWSTLWIVTPPLLQTGINPPAPRPPPPVSPQAFGSLTLESDEEADRSEVSSVNGGPRAEDAPPEPPPAKPNGLQKQTIWLSAKRNSKPAPSPPANSGMTWVEMFLPNELLIYSSPVIEKRGLFSKKRTLVVTDHPRLLCVKEDKSGIKVKHEILFRPLPDVPPGMVPPSGHHRRVKDGHFPIFRSVTQENSKTFWVHASDSKPLRFEDPSGDAERWTAELKLASSRAGPSSLP